MRRVDGLGIAGLLMLAVGAGTFFGARAFLPLWMAWLVGPLLWYLGFAVIVSWLACRIFGGDAQREAEAAEGEAKQHVVIHLRSNFHEHDSEVPAVETGPRKAAVAGISLLALVVVFSSAVM